MFPIYKIFPDYYDLTPSKIAYRNKQIRDLAMEYSLILSSKNIIYPNVNERAFEMAKKFFEFSDKIWKPDNEAY